MRVFTKQATEPKTTPQSPVWPDDTLADIDDAAFARAIAEGREAEQRELVDA
jgi:hypothetical protein